MTTSRPGHHRVDTGLVWTAVALPLGIVILAAGPYRDRRVALRARMRVTPAGVVAGTQRLVPLDRR